MRKFVLLPAALCAAGIAAAIATAQSASTNLEIIGSRLTANALKGDLSFLASDALEGRGTPSRGLEIAAEYIAAQFRRAGLEPTGDDDYFQTANYATVTPNIEGMEFTVEAAGAQVKAKSNGMALQQAAAADLSGAGIVKVAGSDAAAVAALTADQVRGKVLVLDFPAGTNPMMGARQLPALTARLQPALVVLLRSGAQAGNTSARMREVTSAPPVPVLTVWDEGVRTALGAGRPEPVSATVSAHIASPTSTPVKVHNVIGVLRGSDPALRDTYVLLTAHYDHLGIRGTGEGDHIFNGANDDGSGTVSVIEVANALSALPTRPKRSIVFMTFFGEELGLVGSRYYGAHPVFPLAKTVGDLNLEQLGRTDVDGGSSVGLVNVTGFDFSTLTDAVVKAGGNTGLQVVKNAQLNEQFFAQSDNQAMADAGVPAHTLSVGYMFPDYHKAGDEWPKIDYANLALVDRTIAVAVYDVADSADAPQWKDIPQTQRYIKARQQTLGKK
jgi:hypothetical protein